MNFFTLYFTLTLFSAMFPLQSSSVQEDRWRDLQTHTKKKERILGKDSVSTVNNF